MVNGRAGGLAGSAGGLDALRELFVECGLQAEFVPAAAGGLTERLKQAKGSGAPVVAVAGGDGTVACAAAVLAGSGVALGILPFGTMNLLAKDLAIPVGDLRACVEMIARGTRRQIDLAEVNGQVFLCASMLGLPARLGRYREAARESGPRWLQWLRFAWAALRATRRYVRRGLLLEAEGQAVALRTASLTITVNRLGDENGRLFGRSKLDAGALAAYVVQRPDWRKGASMMSGLLRGRRYPELIQERVATAFVVHARRAGIHVMNDGERMVLQPPLRYAIRARALTVIGGSGR